ncbi:MAG TPA: flagellar basal body P-ring formation chaperone FlgA, partial [Dissulfurispiraceae bacterium]|nr:flagellar basal body P-ring formation chaperone FlgA [Dissulfurispiraceae bacterium]
HSLALSLLPFAFCLLFLLPSVALAADRTHLMDTIKKAVLAELVRSVSQNVELGGIRIVKGLDALDDNATYTVDGIAAEGYNGRNKIVYRAVLCDDRRIDHTVFVEAAYDVLTDVFVTVKPLASGSIITANDVYTVKQKNSRLPMEAVTEITGIEGRTLKSNIAQGVILRSDYLRNSAVIKKGREVTVLVEGENVLISTKGVLRNDAEIGGVAQVVCAAQKKDISGILVSTDTVKVKI